MTVSPDRPWLHDSLERLGRALLRGSLSAVLTGKVLLGLLWAGRVPFDFTGQVGLCLVVGTVTGAVSLVWDDRIQTAYDRRGVDSTRLEPSLAVGLAVFPDPWTVQTLASAGRYPVALGLLAVLVVVAVAARVGLGTGREA